MGLQNDENSSSKIMRNATARANGKVKTYAPETIEKIAGICHEANRAWCEAHGDHSQKPWATAEDWQKESMRKGVEYMLSNPDAPQSGQHDAWCKHKRSEGWVYGAEKNADKRTHPCLVPYDQLPVFQQKKDALSRGIINALK